jgi:aminobenzoyl-glutamate utilization protein B
MLTWITLCATLSQSPATQWTEAKRTAVEAVAKRSADISEWSQKIWELAELAFQEHQSARLLADVLESAGFTVQRGIAGMKTAFVAEFGTGRPVVALLAEYDALPGLSQEAAPERRPAPRRDAGHGCGHNLFGAASVGAALAVKEAMLAHSLAGTIRVYGCPAEEGGGGKTYLVRDGRFANVDAGLHWHPSTSNGASTSTCLAVVRFRVRFTGKSAHAAGSPQSGRSAVDGVELMNVGVNYLREHVIPEARIHYVITNGGRRPNVVPDDAEVWYYIRAPKMAQAQAIFERVKKIAQGAALMSETTEMVHGVTGTYELLPNDALAEVMQRNLRLVGPPEFSAAELAFAQKLRENLGLVRDVDLKSGEGGPASRSIDRTDGKLNYGSTDVGDVSWTVPTAGLRIATAARGIPGHSWSFVACSGSDMGKRGAVTAAKILAATAVELLDTPALVAAAKAEFANRTAGILYRPVLNPGPPPERIDTE